MTATSEVAAAGRAVAPRTPRPPPRRRLRLSQSLLTAPAAVYFAAFFLAPVALVAWYSVGFKPGLFGFHDNSTLSLDRYREAWRGPFQSTFRNTLQIATTGTLLCLVIALPFAYFLATKANPRIKSLLLVLVLVPFWCNFLVRTLGWRLILAPESTLSHVLQNLGLTGAPLKVLDTRFAVQLGVVYNYLPLMILPLYVAFDRLDPALREASKDLGANRFKTLVQVTLPVAMPGIATGCLLVFVPLMGDYITASVLGGAKGNMVGLLVASWFEEGSNWALGSAEAVLLIFAILATVAVAAIAAWLVRWGLRRRRRIVLMPAAERAPFRSRGPAPVDSKSAAPSALGRVVAGVVEWALRIWPFVVYLFLFLPIGYIVAYSFNRGRLFASYAGFGVGSYRDALNTPEIVSAVRTSLEAAAGTALLATVLGTLAGLALARSPGRWSKVFTVLLALALVTPEIMLAISELPWFVTLGVDHGLSWFSNGILRLVIAHSLFSTAVVAFIVRARMSGLDQSLEEAAADLYAPPLRRFRQITLPLMMPAVIAGAMMSFTLSLDDVILSSFVSVQGQTPW
ncbi:MAG: spermidine/putrescine transport system permease protein, partial [Pseudonocardiales bacterium]|nr:spermidine/putrescine transport system permease protein [Pseudonocardiales bacterium]